MAINPLSSSISNILSDEALRSRLGTQENSYGGDFSDFLTEAFSTAEQTDAADKLSSLELLSGQTDDMSGLLLDTTKAELSLRLALQIKNKVVEAYNELMRTQV